MNAMKMATVYDSFYKIRISHGQNLNLSTNFEIRIPNFIM